MKSTDLQSKLRINNFYAINEKEFSKISFDYSTDTETELIVKFAPNGRVEMTIRHVGYENETIRMTMTATKAYDYLRHEHWLR